MPDCIPHLNGKPTTYDAIKKQLLQDRDMLSKYVPSAKTDVPQMPFAGNGWKQLGLKIALRKAVESGADHLGWTTGEQQAERYDLSKQIKEVRVSQATDGDFHVAADRPDGSNVISQYYKASELPNVIGKDLADKIVSDADKFDTLGGGRFQKAYSGLDLKVGGEGMKGFYDKELVNIANDLVKKWGVKTGEREIATETEKYLGSVEGNPVISKTPSQTTVHSLPITDSMRRDITEKGFPMFMPKSAPSLQSAKIPTVRNPLAIPPQQDKKREGLEAALVK